MAIVTLGAGITTALAGLRAQRQNRFQVTVPACDGSCRQLANIGAFQIQRNAMGDSFGVGFLGTRNCTGKAGGSTFITCTKGFDFFVA
jgi:hypothetical protein